MVVGGKNSHSGCFSIRLVQILSHFFKKILQSVIDAFDNSIKNGSISDPDDYAVMRSVVEQIIVRKDSMEIEFKCGASMTKEYVR